MTENAEELLAEALLAAQTGVAAVQESFTDPDDDWEPVMFAISDDENVVIGLPPAAFASDRAKDMLCDVALPGIILAGRVRALVMVMSTWEVEYTKEFPRSADPHRQMPPSQHPRRREALYLSGLTATLTRSLRADIQRHPDAPPTLGEWRVREADHPNYDVTGRFIAPLQEALGQVV
jgi:hypothetical protein